jgi:hypothetical protein
MGLTLALASCGGGGGSSSTPAPTPNPVPTLTSISPSSTIAGGESFTVTLTGSNFISRSELNWGSFRHPVTFVSSTQLTAVVSAAEIQDGADLEVRVLNPPPGGGTSEPLTFTVANPVPAITSLSPSHVVFGGAAFTLTVNGTNFVPSSDVNFKSTDRPTTFVSSTQLTATIPAEDIATYYGSPWELYVWNPAPGGGWSNPLEVTFEWPVPVLNSVSPSSALASGPSLNLEVIASGVGAGMEFRWNGTSRPINCCINGHQFAAISAQDIATPETAQLTLYNPPPGGGESAPLNFPILEAPPLQMLTSRLPASSLGKAYEFTLSATGGIPRANSPDAPYSWWVSNGSLPDGLGIVGMRGWITGTVMGATASFTLSVQDFAAVPHVVSRDFTIPIGALGRNDSRATATQISNGTITSSISPYGDEDFYAFQATAGNTVTVEIFAARLPSPSLLDSAIEIVDNNGLRLNTCRSPDHPRDPNDPYNFTILDLTPDAFDDPCACDDIELGVVRDSLLEFRPPASGTYYIHVVDLRGDGRPEFIYDLSLSGAD